MGEIRESLILADNFSSSFSKFLELGNSAVKQMDHMNKSLYRVEKTMRGSIGGAAGAVITNMRQIGEAANQINADGFDRMEEQLNRIANRLAGVTREQKKHNTEVKNTNNSADKLLSTIKRIVAVAAGFTLGKKVISMSDDMTQVYGRLALINDGSQDAAGLQDKIYASAQRSRASYEDTASAIAKMGLNAGNAFNSNDELIAFMEQVNKQFVIGNASSQDMSNGMLQLTQAMAAGTLRGEELNSILDNAPGIARNIEKSMGWAEGSIKQYAEQGVISAEIVKYALLSTAEETNAQFEALPKTWGQAFTQLKNVAVKSLDPVWKKINDFLNSGTGEKVFVAMASGITILADVASSAVDLISSGAQFIVDNWDYVYPVLIGIGAAFLAAGAASVASGLAAAASWAMVNMPIIMISAAVAGFIFILKQVGISWEQMGEVAGGVLGTLYSHAYTVVAYWHNLFSSLAEFVINVLKGPENVITASAHLIFDLLDNVLSALQAVAGAIDTLFNTNYADKMAGFRNDLSSWVDDKFGENAVQVKKMASLDVKETINKSALKGKSLGKKLDESGLNMDKLKNFFDENGSGSGTEGLLDGLNVNKVGSVGKIEKDVNLADENIKLLRDMSERRYVAAVNLTLPQTNVSVNQSVTGGSPSDIQAIADGIKNLLLEGNASHSSVTYG